MNPLKTPKKSIIILWLCYAIAGTIFILLPLPENPDGPGKLGAVIAVGFMVTIPLSILIRVFGEDERTRN